ncbi:hypothetical protein ACN28S_18275 [Cystobacter fuscus]
MSAASTMPRADTTVRLTRSLASVWKAICPANDSSPDIRALIRGGSAPGEAAVKNRSEGPTSVLGSSNTGSASSTGSTSGEAAVSGGACSVSKPGTSTGPSGTGSLSTSSMPRRVSSSPACAASCSNRADSAASTSASCVRG